MDYLIFKTDIKTRRRVDALRSAFRSLSAIKDWSIDMEDIDNVLRVESHEDLSERDVIELVTQQGFFCEVLPD